MKTHHARPFLALSLLAMLTAAYGEQRETPVPIDTQKVPPYLAERVKEKAQQGPTALRRFLNNTRTTNDLYFWDLVKESPPTSQARKDSPKQVVAEKEARKD